MGLLLKSKMVAINKYSLSPNQIHFQFTKFSNNFCLVSKIYKKFSYHKNMKVLVAPKGTLCFFNTKSAKLYFFNPVSTFLCYRFFKNLSSINNKIESISYFYFSFFGLGFRGIFCNKIFFIFVGKSSSFKVKLPVGLVFSECSNGGFLFKFENNYMFASQFLSFLVQLSKPNFYKGRGIFISNSFTNFKKSTFKLKKK